MNLGMVVVGAAVGAPLRYLVDRSIRSLHSGDLPLGTLAVNLAASAVFGLVIGSASSHSVQLLLGTGFCATLSTYSTFSYETVRLAEEDGTPLALLYVCLSVVGGLGAAALGVWLA